MTETVIYLACAAVLAAALPATVWLKRAGDAEWRRRRTRTVTLLVTLDATAFAPAMARAVRAAADMQAAMAKLSAALTTPREDQ